MKRIIFILIITTLFMPIVSASTWFDHWEKIESMIITFIRGDEIYSNYPFLFKMEDGKTVYCVKPFTQISHDEPYTEYNYNDPSFDINDNQLEKIKLIAYYGYNYPGHEDVKWYGLTQFLIWKTFNLDDIYFVDSKGGDRIQAYEEEINEIETLVQNHNVLPSFLDETMDYKENSNYILTDTNNVLSNYRIKNSNINAQIIGNELSINTTKDGTYSIEFEKIYDLNNDYILYGVKDYQSLFYPGGIESITFNLDIEVNTGTIIIEKNDSEGIIRNDATLEGATYSVIKDGVEVNRISTNADGIAIISDLYLGEYLVKEIEASNGYTLDNNTYYVNLTKEQKEIHITSYEKIIKGKVVLNKYYGEENNYELEEGALFELYSNNELIGTYETANGVIEDIVPYGDYYLKQIVGKEGYKLIEYYEFSVLEEKEYNIDLYDDPMDEDVIYVEDIVDPYDDIVELEVEVPNTGAKSKLKYCALFINIGIVFVIFSFKYNTYNKK